MKVKKKSAAPLVVELPYTEVKQGGKSLLLTSMPAWVLTEISYVAVRRVDDEEGAVQRPLNEKRISKIRDFALAGGDFPACIILNWVNSDSLSIKPKTIRVTVSSRSAQVIDGQHRVSGIEEAIKSRKALRNMAIPVAIYRQLTTKQCADIFLSINTEQKPVQKSLAFDLFGIASEHLVDQDAIRAADIAEALNDEEESAYRELVKYSGPSHHKGPKVSLGIALSTMVNALKPLVSANGVFGTMGVRELVNQTKVVMTFFVILKEWYGDEWEDRNNAFMHAAGFTGAIEFLKLHLIPHCGNKRKYTSSVMRDAMDLDRDARIYREELVGLQGRAAARKVTERLIGQFKPARVTEDDIEF